MVGVPLRVTLLNTYVPLFLFTPRICPVPIFKLPIVVVIPPVTAAGKFKSARPVPVTSMSFPTTVLRPERLRTWNSEYEPLVVVSKLPPTIAIFPVPMGLNGPCTEVCNSNFTRLPTVMVPV